MLKSESYLERGDAPAQAVLRANAEQQAVRKAIETQEELHKIRERVCIVSIEQLSFEMFGRFSALGILCFITTWSMLVLWKW